MNKTRVQVNKDLISINEAVGIVLESVNPLPSMRVMLQGSKSYRLSQSVYADMDAPSFDRAMMDGYALKASTSGEGVEIEIVGVIAAGEFRSEPVPPGKAVKIMTGAPMPEGADAVIEVELTEVVGENKVRLDASVKPGKNIAFKGEEMKSGQEILKVGTFIDAPVAAVLAMAGKSMVDVYSLPRIGILVTGTELIDPGNPLKPGQIRETNTFSLTAQSLIWGGIPIRLGKAGDDPESLKAGIRRGLEYEIFTITGGVSMGDYDLVPEMLREMGVEVLFHKVAQKPGKPILYGRKGPTHVFGLPGNPVAT
ncbi:molybdopterin molybdotransferase MoeA, partial [bacterium]|nr:molybdopterin molybdotransferase MoeA [bacterium]